MKKSRTQSEKKGITSIPPKTLQKQYERAIIRAAIEWWESRRPVEWDELKHITSPAVNISDEPGKKLAEKVSVYILAKDYYGFEDTEKGEHGKS